MAPLNPVTFDCCCMSQGRNDLQTEADRAAQRCIVATLQQQFPKVTIFGEESLDPSDRIPDDYIVKELDHEVLSHSCPDSYQTVTDDQIVIWVDPLDGTAEFTQGLLDHVTILIGVAINGEAKGGVIYQPYYNYQAGADATLGRCIWGLIGLGSFGYKPQLPPDNQNVITTTRSHADWMVTEAVNSCQPTEVIKVGGAGHKVLLLIEGRAHAYVFASKGCKKWDTCAPEAVLHSVGGRLTDLLGNPILYHDKVRHPNAGGVLATLSNHDWYVDKIPDSVKANFVSDTPSEDMVLLRQQANSAASCVPSGDTSNREGTSVDPPEFNKAA